MPDIILYPVADTYCPSGDGYYNINYGTSQTLQAGADPNNPQSFPVFKFDYTQIPPNVNITTVKLRVYRVQVSIQASASFEIYGFSKNWEENTLTFLGIGSYGPRLFSSVLLTTSAISNIWDEYPASSSTFTNYIKEGYNDPGLNRSLLIFTSSYTGNRYVRYASKEYSNPDYRPQLVVTYEEFPSQIPTNLIPNNGAVINRAEINRLSWQFNPSFSGDYQSKYDLQWSSDDGQTWTTITETTQNNYCDISADILTQGNIVWRVRTYNSKNIVSGYSNQNIFISSQPPEKPTITTTVIDNATPIITWDSENQAAYEITILQGQNQHEFSGLVYSEDKFYQVTEPLETDNQYTFRLRVQNADGLFSDYEEKVITTSFGTPEPANISVITNNVRGYSVISIANVEGIVEFLENQLYRREIGKEDFIRIAKGIEWNGEYIDYTQRPNSNYEYLVRTVGITMGFADSNIVTSKITVKHPQLALVNDYNICADLKYNLNRVTNYGTDRRISYFNGRSKGVAEYSEFESLPLQLSFVVRDEEELEKIINLCRSKDYLLYRDNKGKRLFCSTTNLEIGDSYNRKYYTVTLTLDEVDFSEVVR